MKKLLIISILFLSLLCGIRSVFAFDYGVDAVRKATPGPDVETLLGGIKDSAGTENTEIKTLGDKSLTELLATIIANVMTYIGIIMFVLFVYAGVLYMVGIQGGNEGTIEKAKSILKWTVIGAVVIFGAYALVSAVVTPIVGQFVK